MNDFRRDYIDPCIVKVGTEVNGELVNEETIISQSIGQALDAHASDPAEGATFHVTFISKGTVVFNV